jgi:hypothetical protein
MKARKPQNNKRALASKNSATTREMKGTRSKKASLPQHDNSLYELLESTDEEEDKPERIYHVMARNHVRNFFAEESMTDKQCDKDIQQPLKKSLKHSHVIFLIVMTTKKIQCQNNH